MKDWNGAIVKKYAVISRVLFIVSLPSIVDADAADVESSDGATASVAARPRTAARATALHTGRAKSSERWRAMWRVVTGSPTSNGQ
ncbi:hypothetical protein [Cryobacterium arcticum]|uniref:hypothetical protein n=1 Tax=Cryobacterium arcticum TaxID=670052 RepID=UPI0012EEAA0D|nr:hypothetical protein [Cryobacterium arcticum]